MMRDYSPSESSEYYLPREEFLTVLHFARSYPEWKQTLSIRPGVTAMRYDEDKVQTSPKCDSLEKIAIRRVELSKRCKLIEDTVHDVGDDIYDYLLNGVTCGTPCYQLIQMGMPCSEATYYRRRRRFYYELSHKISVS
jgi:hypothetical protein